MFRLAFCVIFLGMVGAIPMVAYATNKPSFEPTSDEIPTENLAIEKDCLGHLEGVPTLRKYRMTTVRKTTSPVWGQLWRATFKDAINSSGKIDIRVVCWMDGNSRLRIDLDVLGGQDPLN